MFILRIFSFVAKKLFRESMKNYLHRFYNPEYVDSLEEALKTPGTKYYLRVNTLKADTKEVVYRLREEGYDVHLHPIISEAIYTYVRGPHRVNLHSGHVIVDWKTAESVYMGAYVYAPGVQKIVNAERGDLVTVFSPDGEPVAEGILERSPSEIFREKRGIAVRTTNSVYKIPSLREHPFFREGILYHQSLPSMVAVKLLAPMPGWTILDMCASPGGKATHAAILMGDEGEVIAVDRSEKKVQTVDENARRLGLRSVKTLVYDSRYISEILDPESVDAVILDPPCTTLGIRPKLIYTREERDVYQLSQYQRQFLSEARKVLRRNGLLLYTTCTLTPHENEFNMIYAASELGLKPLGLKPPFPLRSPLLGVEGVVFDPVLNDTPGFFISVLRKS